MKMEKRESDPDRHSGYVSVGPEQKGMPEEAKVANGI